jgi:hypothetical protein
MTTTSFFDSICTPGYTGFSLSLSPANTNTTVNASNNTAFHILTLLATDFRSWGLGMSRRVAGVINLMYFRYEKFKKWMQLGWPAGRSGVGLNKAARIIHKNNFPIGAAAALNEGVSTGFRS